MSQVKPQRVGAQAWVEQAPATHAKWLAQSESTQQCALGMQLLPQRLKPAAQLVVEQVLPVHRKPLHSPSLQQPLLGMQRLPHIQ